MTNNNNNYCACATSEWLVDVKKERVAVRTSVCLSVYRLIKYVLLFSEARILRILCILNEVIKEDSTNYRSFPM